MHATPDPCMQMHMSLSNRLNKREADPFAHKCEVRSVRPARRLSRPSMGRDTLTLPKQKK